MAADIIAAITQQGLNDILKKLTRMLTRSIRINNPYTGNLINGKDFQVFYSIEASNVEFDWERSKVSLDATNNRINIDELDIIYNKLSVKLIFYIADVISPFLPTVQTIVIPGGRWGVHSPSVIPIPRFSKTFSVDINLDNFRSEISAGLSFAFEHYNLLDDDIVDGNLVSPALRNGRSRLFGDDANTAIQPGWELRITSGDYDIDVLDTSDMITDKFDAAVNRSVQNLPPGIASILTAWGGNVSKAVRKILDWPDDVGEKFGRFLSTNDCIVSIQEEISKLFGFLYLVKIVDPVQISLPNSGKVIELSLNILPDLKIEGDELIFRLTLKN